MRLFTLVILSMLATVASADPWLCTTTQSTGFVFRNGGWAPATFAIEDGRYILRKLTKYDFYFRGQNQYGLFKLGTDMLGMPCGGAPISENVFCGDVTRHFKFSTQSGRFLMTFMSGYWDSVTDETPEIPQISIGRCSKI